jgi:hypothetical protein
MSAIVGRSPRMNGDAARCLSTMPSVPVKRPLRNASTPGSRAGAKLR